MADRISPSPFMITCDKCSYTGLASDMVEIEHYFISDETGCEYYAEVKCPQCGNKEQFY